MPRLGIRTHALAPLLFLAVALAGCDRSERSLQPEVSLEEAAGSGHGYRGAPGFGVYTQNVYLGGDTGPLFTLDFSDIPRVIAETNTFWADVQASDAPSRMAEVVDEIALRSPEVVGLQEVLRFVVLDGAFQPAGGIDLLAAIEGEIAARGLPYTTEVVQEATSSTLPMGFDPSTGGISRWLNFTDRVVVLRRDDVELVETAQGVYAARIPLGPLDVTRGWARVTVRRDGVTYHVINTHLETQAVPPVQAGQLQELRDVVAAGLDGVTIIAGDLNSNAAAEAGDPTWTPTYDALIADGFIDVWERAPHRRRDRGLTCCHDPSLMGYSDFTQRIDFVLIKPPAGDDESEYGPWEGRRRGAFRATVVGEAEGDRTGAGLWPSDHAGLVARFRLPRGLR